MEVSHEPKPRYGESIPSGRYRGKAVPRDMVYGVDTDFQFVDKPALRPMGRDPRSDKHVDQLVKEGGEDKWKMLDKGVVVERKFGWPVDANFQPEENVPPDRHKDVSCQMHDHRWEDRANYAARGARDQQLPPRTDLHDHCWEGRTEPAEDDRAKRKMLATHMNSQRWQQRAGVAYGGREKKKAVAEAAASVGLHAGRWEARADHARGRAEGGGHGAPVRPPLDSHRDVRAFGEHQREEARKLNADPPEKDNKPRVDNRMHSGRWQDRAFQAKDNQRYKPKHTVPAGEPNRQHEARGHVHKGDPAPGYVPKDGLHEGRWEARAGVAHGERRPERAPVGEHLPPELERMGHAVEGGFEVVRYGEGEWEGCHGRAKRQRTKP